MKHYIYILHNICGYYVCYTALRTRFVTIAPISNYADAVAVAWEAAREYRTGQARIEIR